MQGDGGRALLFGDATCVDVGVVGVVNADAELDCHRHAGALGGADGGGDDLAEQPSFVGQCRSAAAACDFGHRAAEVHVDVVGEVVLDDHPGRLVGGGRVDGVELQRARRLLRGERRHVHRDGVALDQGAGGDHLADVEAADGARPGFLEFAAQGAERDVGDPGHGRQDNRAAEGEGPDPQPGSGW